MPNNVDSLIAQSREPQFVSSAYFLRFKFEEGKYALVGKETIDGRELLKVEYYPARLFSDDTDRNKTARYLALAVFTIEFIVSVGLWWSFDAGSRAWQAPVDMAWIPSWGIRFTLGVDGISLMMVLLTTFIMPLTVLGGWTSVKTKMQDSKEIRTH